MKKRILPALTAISFLLMLAAIAVTIHGYWAFDATGWYSNHWNPDNHVIGRRISIAAKHGQFQFRCIRVDENWSIFSPANNPGNSPREQQRLATLAKLHTDIPELAQWKFISQPSPATPDADLLKQSLIGFEKFVEPQFSTGGCIAIPALFPLHWLERRYRPRKSNRPAPGNSSFTPPIPDPD